MTVRNAVFLLRTAWKLPLRLQTMDAPAHRRTTPASHIAKLLKKRKQLFVLEVVELQYHLFDVVGHRIVNVMILTQNLYGPGGNGCMRNDELPLCRRLQRKRIHGPAGTKLPTPHQRACGAGLPPARLQPDKKICGHTGPYPQILPEYAGATV
jgi:hypothetical protein